MHGKVKLQHTEDYYIKVLLKETKLKEVMSSPPISIGVEENFKEVPKKFRESGIRHLPVVGKDNKLVGIISQRDLFRIQPPQKNLEGELCYDNEMLAGVILKHVMIQDPVFMYEDDPLGEAVVRIVGKKIGCIPIVNKQNQLTGVLTQMDILKVAVQIYLEG